MQLEGSTIVAVSTPPGTGGLAVIRMSGPKTLDILAKRWRGKNPIDFKSHTAHLGWILDSEDEDVDQVVVTVFRAPNSYTGEDVVEISCHGSRWIQNAVVNSLIEAGAAAAGPGEFTQRAFMNGRLDLVQAEGIADMILASSKASARLARTQLKGDFSKRFERLRTQLVNLGVLLELELDFSEEDVEFADRKKLIDLAREILKVVRRLADSFKAGNVFKNGVPVAIAGVPNAGKSTLLNALIGEEKAIVSDIPGTTRDAIEDTIEINGILFRLIDTAGLRESADRIERIGVDKARQKIGDAAIVLHLIDPTQDLAMQLSVLDATAAEESGKKILVATKGDISRWEGKEDIIAISAKEEWGIEELKARLAMEATSEFNPENELIVTNARHYEALKRAIPSLERLIYGLENGLSADFLAQDLRESERSLGEITGSVSSDEILHTIFSRYCIGK